MRSSRLGAVTGLVAVAVLIPAHSAAAATVWRFEPDPLVLGGVAELTDVAFPSAGEAWVAGFHNSQDNPTRAVVARWDGQLKPVATAPAGPGVAVRLAGIETSGSKVFAVGRATFPEGGTHPRIEVYDRTAPDAGGVVVTDPIQDELGELTAISEDAEWIAGMRFAPSDGRGETLTLRRNGDTETWSRLPSPNPGEYNQLNDISSTEDGTYGAGVLMPADPAAPAQPLLIRWDATGWTQLPCVPPDGASGIALGVAVLGPDRVLLAGFGRTPDGRSHALAMLWNGTSCITVRSPNPDATVFGDVVALGENDALLAGYGMRGGVEVAEIEQWNGETLVPTTVPGPGVAVASEDQYPASGANAIAAASDTRLLSVGWQLTGPTTHEQPAILRND